MNDTGDLSVAFLITVSLYYVIVYVRDLEFIIYSCI